MSLGDVRGWITGWTFRGSRAKNKDEALISNEFFSIIQQTDIRFHDEDQLIY